VAEHFQLYVTLASCPYDVLPNTHIPEEDIKVMEDNTDDEPQRVFNDEFP